MRPIRLSVALQVLLVFAGGALVGGLGYRLYTRQHKESAPIEGRKGPEPRDFRKMYIAEMSSRLKLRQDQVQKLSEIMDSTEHRFRELRKSANDEVWKRLSPEMKTISDQQRESILAILDPSQQKEFEKMLTERAKTMERRGGRRFGPSGPPPR